MAEEDMFDSAMASLQKPQEPRRLLQILVALRKEMEWPKHQWNMLKFYDMGCMKPLFRAMQRVNGSILDVCLSILGNCAMDRYIARNLVKVYNILPILSKLLKQHEDNDSINGRIFRIVGNISRHWECFTPHIFDQEPELIKHIVDYLKKCATTENCESTSATINMGIRALREMTNRDTVNSLVNRFEVLQTIGLVLIKYSPKWREERTHREIVSNIIRFLDSFSCYKHSKSVQYLKNTGGGDSLQCLSNIIPLDCLEVVNIVMNLIVTTNLKSDLPIPEICEALQKMIQHQLDTDKASSTLSYYIRSLCTLFTHPANRSDDRNKGSIPFLIHILKELNVQTTYLALPFVSNQDKKKMNYSPLVEQLNCCISIIMTLQLCMYDESLVTLQLKHDIIDVLVEKLEWFTGTSNTLNLKHDICLMKSWSEDVPNKKRRTSYKEYVFTIPEDSTSTEDAIHSYSPYRCPSSPSASSENSYYSGRLSPSSSTSTGIERNFFVDSDDDYSPVCSECEDNVEDETKEIKEILDEEIKKLPEDNVKVLKKLPLFEDERLSLVQRVLIREVVTLLKWFSRVRPVIPQLGTMRVMKALLKSSEGILLHSTSNNINLIMKILESQEYLLPLLQTEFVPMVYELVVTQHRRCKVCQEYQQIGLLIIRRLTLLAQSGCGKGDIAHHLIRGSDSTKKKLVQILPYVIRNKPTLSKFMITCGGLEVLMKLLQENSPDQQQRSIKTLCMMAVKKLRIKNPKNSVEAVTTKEIQLLNDYTPPECCKNIVTFILNDGKKVSADRNFLSEKSDYFSTLLCGHFKESQQDVIELRNVDERMFKSLLTLLNCDIKSSVLLKTDLDLDGLLGLIELADKFLFADLCSSLTDSVEKFHMSSTTVSQIYQWSVESGTNILKVETVAYALVANISDTERFSIFKDLFQLGYCEQLVEDIRKLLERFLNASIYSDYSEICNTDD